MFVVTVWGRESGSCGQKKVSSPNSQAARVWRFVISKLNNARPGWHAKAIRGLPTAIFLGIEKFVVISRKAKNLAGLLASSLGVLLKLSKLYIYIKL